MKIRRYLLAGAAALALIGAAVAQQLTSLTLTGAETIVASIGGPQGQSFFVTTAQLRNATGNQLLSAATSGTFSPTNGVNTFIIAVQPNGTTTINTPTAPWDGQLFQVCNGSNAALTGQTVTLAATAGSSLATGVVTALGTLAARTCEEIIYTSSNTTWYQIR
jgi:hypothetical protein